MAVTPTVNAGEVGVSLHGEHESRPARLAESLQREETHSHHDIQQFFG